MTKEKITDISDFTREQIIEMNRHPDMDIRFDRVTLTLTTHGEGGITQNDFSPARQCDEVFSRFLTA